MKKRLYPYFLVVFLLVLLLSFSVYASARNVVANYDMEQGNDGKPSYWKTWCFYGREDCQFIWDNTVAHSGTYSLKIKEGIGSWSTTFPTTPGKLYRISFYYKAKSKKEYNPNAKMNCYLSNRNKGIVLRMRKICLKTYDGWLYVNVGDYVAEADIKSLELNLKLNTSQGDDSEVWFDDVSVMEMDPPSGVRHGFLLSGGGDHTIWAESASQKIFRDDPPPNSETQMKKIQIRAAKGETEPFQIVIKPNTKWTNVSWDWTDITGPSVIPKDNMKYHRVEYVNITEPTKVYRRRGLNPDPLPVEKSSTLLPGENSPFWFIVDVPSSTSAGTYRTNLFLLRGANRIVTIPIELKVWNFVIPLEPTINIDSHIWMKEVMKFEEGDYQNKSERFGVAKRYYKNVFEHRATSGPVTFLPVEVIDGHAKTDTADFERHVGYLKTLGNCSDLRIYDVLKITGEKVKRHQWRTNSKWQGIPIFLDAENAKLNPQFVTPFSEHVLQIMDALKRQGCYSHPYIKFFDEPDITHQPTVNAVTEIAKLLRQIDPNICPAGSGLPHQDFMEYFGRWDFSPSRIPFYSKELSQARASGAAWVYDNSIALVDLPLFRIRLFQWMLWKEKFNGAYNWWSITYWKENPWTTIPRNGKGTLLYPPRNRLEKGPLTSLRWEMMRQGLEDYEYLHLLEQLIAENRATVSHELISTAESALKRVDEIVYRLPMGCNDQPYTLDTALVEEVRIQIAEAIESLISSGNGVSLPSPAKPAYY